MQTRRCPSASKIAAICRSRARRTTPGELCHRDRLAALDGLFERGRHGPAVRIVEVRVWIVAVGLVRVEVRQRRDGIRIWVELRSRVGCGGRCVPDRTSPGCVRSGVEAGAAGAVCWQGNRGVVGVEFWPLNLLICLGTRVGLGSINTRRDRSKGRGRVGDWGHVLLSKSPNRFLVNFHTKKPTTHNTATPPATESPIMVDVEMPEPPPPPPDLLLAAVPEGDAEEEEDAPESETKTMLVTTWPPGSVVTTAEVIVGVAVAELLGVLLGVLVDCADCVVDCCAADVGLDGVVVDCCCCCCCDDEAAGVFEEAACCCGVEAACDVAAAGEVLAAAEEAWRGERTCDARESCTGSLCSTRTNIRSPARVATIPKNGTLTARIFEDRAEMGVGIGKER
jgi:hypothetical protein